MRRNAGITIPALVLAVVLPLAANLPAMGRGSSPVPRPAALAAARTAPAVPPGTSGPPVPAGDEVVTGTGDTSGWHLYAASSGDRWQWHALATLRPADDGEEGWIGQQCLTGDGRVVIAVVAPWHANNSGAGLDRGGMAYAVDAHTGTVRPLASGVSLAYFDPGCGTGHQVALTSYLGQDEGTTRVAVVDG